MTVTGWLLDASVLLELRRANPEPKVAAWSDAQPRESLFLSEATIAAIRHRSERSSAPELRTEIGVWLDQSLRPWFAGRVLPVTEEIVLESLRLRRQRGATVGHTGRSDLLLAATARVHALTLCARSIRAYLDLGVPAFTPWQRVTDPPDPADPNP